MSAQINQPNSREESTGEGPGKGAAPMAGGTRGDRAYQRLRQAIINGDLPPGVKLKPARLNEIYDLGLTPIREALSRLSSESLVVMAEQRGFSVAPVSREELSDLLELRIDVESRALERSLKRGGDQWEADLLAAFHRLSKVPVPEAGASAEETARWERRHDAFHDALISACLSPWLIKFRSSLDLQIERYHRLLLFPPAMRNSPELAEAITAQSTALRALLSLAVHEDLLTAALGRDRARCLALITRHYRETGKIFDALSRAGLGG
ncbi:GntR family transcriptional regulator [Rhodovibrionaceae bacterium A322]